MTGKRNLFIVALLSPKRAVNRSPFRNALELFQVIDATSAEKDPPDRAAIIRVDFRFRFGSCVLLHY
jgi:hypothetical protein